MGNVSEFTRRQTRTAKVIETSPEKTKNPAMETEVKSTKLQDVTTFIFQQLSEGEICRFGEGWITRCPECDNLISISSEFKTFGIKDKDMWRLAPSLSCPNDECNWHRSIVIDPEEFEEVDEEDFSTEEEEGEVIITTDEGVEA